MKTSDEMIEKCMRIIQRVLVEFRSMGTFEHSERAAPAWVLERIMQT